MPSYITTVWTTVVFFPAVPLIFLKSYTFRPALGPTQLLTQKEAYWGPFFLGESDGA
jgi:hypothetical protein